MSVRKPRLYVQGAATGSCASGVVPGGASCAHVLKPVQHAMPHSTPSQVVWLLGGVWVGDMSGASSGGQSRVTRSSSSVLVMPASTRRWPSSRMSTMP